MVSQLCSIETRIPSCGLALIDIPVGLKERGPDGRRCDREARTLLGRPRSSSVFPAHCRAVLAARDLDYRDLCVLNRRYAGRGLPMEMVLPAPRVDAKAPP